MKKALGFLGGLAAALLATSASAATAPFFDAFTRANNTNLGADWAEVGAGGMQILNNAMTSIDPPSDFAMISDLSGNTAAFDFAANPTPTGVHYVAGILGNPGGNDSFFVKLEGSAGSGVFDTIAFNTGNNVPGVSDALTAAITSGHVQISILGTVATIIITQTGGPDQTYSHDYGFAPGSMGVGVGIAGGAFVDNFAATLEAAPDPIPLPAALPLMLLGIGALGGARIVRRRQV